MVHRRRRQVNPRTIKKRSDVVRLQEQEASKSFLIKGKREETNTGYKVVGFTGKFETYFEFMLPKTSTNVYSHPAKTRTYRVLTGGGALMKLKDVKVGEETKVETSVQKLSAGDEVVVEPGTSFRLLATDFGLEMFVTQEEKYDSRLKKIADTEVMVEAPSDLLDPPSEEEVEKATEAAQGIRARRGSKAAQQQSAQKPTQGGAAAAEPLERMPEAASVGVNARPTMGNFRD